MEGMNAATVTSNGFMKKVTYFAGDNEGEEVYVNDPDLDLANDDDLMEIEDQAREKVNI